MSIGHLRNTLKMIVERNNSMQERCPHNVADAITFSDEEIEKLTNKTQYQNDNEDNLWKE